MNTTNAIHAMKLDASTLEKIKGGTNEDFLNAAQASEKSNLVRVPPIERPKHGKRYPIPIVKPILQDI
ncbi:hypothetical protein KTT66_08360 [Lacticaseibacillus casei]|jgi:hypothetical protein|uniref:Bacteriocin n=1 Tax=Lacticaseibacillus huelsenbergensis TaxID=3035291 RepID=A0ABY8DZ73_9LACO|nr:MULTISPECIES: hypothetical protein [Lacticaseibacillus]MDG3062344.1 hypothetical protein [Lacticaseibacillus sp. BCRC 81376]QVI36415.1 hypothetical protein KGS74_09130 [Lacticaseibacillus casei]QXG58214.1 hypothetical protein KTT66_08360 [Lacticaseibacillus casei]WFB40313.1 hypothetical protein LHUE1_001095 [Lacticaseibacillus huelsenbergensis]WFB42064.1 hypothetical protein LHUE2_000019 [Lacticaseibacillus huelsenbergensis]